MSDTDTPAPAASAWASERTFADFPISTEVLAGIEAMGFTRATPVQALTIEPALAGRDLLVRAKTGTGKTAAFCVPIVERIPAGDRVPRALILAPTRELAVQVSQECANIAKFKDLRVCAIYGGVGFGPQEQALRDGVEIVVGTPGRILDHLRRGNLKLDGLQYAVLDEADEMLSMGFLEDVRRILDKAPKSRQSFMFSATVDAAVKNLIASYLHEPEEIFLSTDGDNVDTITHYLYETSPDYHKARALLDLIEQEKPTSAIVFCNTREDVSTVYTYLDRQGLGVEMLSGELPQKQRERVMARVKAGAVQFLVSTDVAARGIDISDLSHVINYSLPEDAAVYLHRCGRTGRIGKTGTVLNLVGGQDFGTRQTLDRQHKIKFELRNLPTPDESAQLRTDRLARLVKDAAGSTAYEAYLDVVRALKERPDADTLLAVMLKAFLGWDRQRRLAAADEAASAGADGEARTDDARREDDGRRRDRDDRRDRDGRSRDGRRDDKRRDDRRGDRGEKRDDRPRDDRPREDRPREDRPREDRGEKREERPREERDSEKREERPAREGEARAERSEGEARPERSERRSRHERRPKAEPTGEKPVEPAADAPAPVDAPVPAAAEDGGDDDETEETEAGEAGGAGEADAAKKKRRRRRRRRTGAPGSPAGGGDAPGGTPAAE